MWRPVFILCLFFVLILSACQSNNEQISFMVFGDPAERQAYQQLVDAFHEKYQDIEVEMTHIPSPRDYRTRLVTEFAAGTPPDVTLMNYRRYASFAAKGLLEPLGDYIADSELIQPEDFYPATIEAFVWRDEMMCIPQNISSLVVYYNQDLFDAANVPYPSDRWRWDEFVETAVALTKDFDEDGRIDQYGLGVDPSLFRLVPFIWQNGAVIVDDIEHPTRLTLTRPPTQDALRWFVDLRQLHGVVPDRVEEKSLDSESRFLSGTTAMFLNSRRGTPAYREIDSFIWDVAPLPNNKIEAGILHSDAYCMSATTDNKSAAWRFIEFANSFEGQSIIAQSGRTVPSNIAVAESELFLESGLPPRRSYVFTNNASIVKRVPVISTWQEIERVASEEIERAFYGDITVEEASNLAVVRTEEYFLIAQFAIEP